VSFEPTEDFLKDSFADKEDMVAPRNNGLFHRTKRGVFPARAGRRKAYFAESLFHLGIFHEAYLAASVFHRRYNSLLET
jgi:hypothetical protein